MLETTGMALRRSIAVDTDGGMTAGEIAELYFGAARRKMDQARDLKQSDRGKVARQFVKEARLLHMLARWYWQGR